MRGARRRQYVRTDTAANRPGRETLSSRRFANLVWTVLAPERSAHWNGTDLVFGPGATRADAPAEDELEAMWLRYDASIFNPARPKPKAMRAEMPKRFWQIFPKRS